MKPFDEFKPGDLFHYAERLCTIEIREIRGAEEPVIMSLSDGWSGLVKWQYEAPDGTPRHMTWQPERIEMPTTPLELVNFIRRYQFKYDDILLE